MFDKKFKQKNQVRTRYPAFFAIRYPAGYPPVDTGYPLGRIQGILSNIKKYSPGGQKPQFILDTTSNGQNIDIAPDTTVNWI